MTDEDICKHMGWYHGFLGNLGRDDFAERVRSVVAAAEARVRADASTAVSASDRAVREALAVDSQPHTFGSIMIMALETIASLPLEEQDTMISANMRHVARMALKCRPIAVDELSPAHVDAAGALRQETEAADVMQWRPIEIAPTDGSWILLTGGSIEYGWDNMDDQPVMVVGQKMTEGWQFAWYDGGYYGEYVCPTQWMPLPEPPSTAAGHLPEGIPHESASQSVPSATASQEPKP